MPTATKKKKIEVATGIEPKQINSVIVPKPTIEEMKDGIIYLYGLKPVGMLVRAVVYKVKDDKIIEVLETVETTKQLQIQHIAQAIDVPGYTK